MGRHFRGFQLPTPSREHRARRGTPLRSRPQNIDPSLRSGFRHAAQLLACPEQMSNANLSNGPRKRLNFESLRARAIIPDPSLRLGISAAGSRSRHAYTARAGDPRCAHARKTSILRCAQDFGTRLKRRVTASTPNLSGRAIIPDPSLRLGISAAGSRYAHARKTPQLRSYNPAGT